MQSRVVEEVKVCVLYKVTLRVPRVGGQWTTRPCLEFFSFTPAKAPPSPWEDHWQAGTGMGGMELTWRYQSCRGWSLVAGCRG